MLLTESVLEKNPFELLLFLLFEVLFLLFNASARDLENAGDLALVISKILTVLKDALQVVVDFIKFVTVVKKVGGICRLDGFDSFKILEIHELVGLIWLDLLIIEIFDELLKLRRPDVFLGQNSFSDLGLWHLFDYWSCFQSL